MAPTVPQEEPCRLVEMDPDEMRASPELRAMVEEARERIGLRTYRHHESDESLTARALMSKTGRVQRRILTVSLSVETFDLEEAYLRLLGVRRWRHVSVGIYGSLQKRLEDARRIGRPRGPGERSPVPLPDWYDLTHIAYGHPELGFDQTLAVWQYLPSPIEPYLNIAEALHLRQPA